MSKSRLDLKKCVTAKQKFAALIATSLGAGLFPKAPGTFGSLYAIPLILWQIQFDLPGRLLILALITVIGTWSAMIVEEVSGTADNQSIVIDEVAGMLVTCLALEAALGSKMADYAIWIAFGLFRLFDVIKIWPVNLADRWSKKSKSPMGRAFGVILDDLIAGVQAALVLWLLSKYCP